MRSKRKTSKAPAQQVVKDIRWATRKQYNAEEKIRIVLEGLRGEDSIAELCRCEGISQGVYYKWSKDFMEAGKRRLAKQTLDRLGIARPTFYRWYDLYQRFGETALKDKRPGPRRAWNRIPGDIQEQILEMALERC